MVAARLANEVGCFPQLTFLVILAKIEDIFGLA
jgi:hypothetical protein